jgi:hypothetical protein
VEVCDWLLLLNLPGDINHEIFEKLSCARGLWCSLRLLYVLKVRDYREIPYSLPQGLASLFTEYLSLSPDSVRAD